MQRLFAFIFTIAGALCATIPAAYPLQADAARPDCISNQNIAEVHRHLSGAISQLNHDDRDYGGHRVAAVNDLIAAQGQLDAARAYAVNHDRENPSCFQAYGPSGGDGNPTLRQQPASNRNLLIVRRRLEAMIDQLQRDQHDYDGHRVAAIGAMQTARNELVVAETFARQHGY